MPDDTDTHDPALAGLTVLVTGGAGFIGRHVVAHLLGGGATVRVLDQSTPGDLDPRVEFLAGSIANVTLVESSAAGCDIVIHLAAHSLPGSGSPALSAEVRDHVQVAVSTAEIAATQGVKRFIFAGSGGTAYGYGGASPLQEDMPTAPINAYGVSKLSIEHYLRLISRNGTMRTTTLRISNPYGEGQRAHRAQGFVAAAMQHAMTGTPLQIWGDGSIARDFLHIADVARAFAAACTAPAPPELVNIGSGQATSLLEILERTEAATGRRIALTFGPGRTVDVPTNRLDITRARETLGWSPRISLTEGLSRTAAWWRSPQITHALHYPGS